MRALLGRSAVRRRLASGLIFIVALAGLVGANYYERVLNAGVVYGADLAPVKNAGSDIMAINTFLDREPDRAKVEQSLRLAANAGFKYVRQIFPWYDIEIAAKGDFTDHRHAEAVSAWDKYDFIVDTANSLGLEVLARVDGTPLWAGPGDATATAIGYYKGPPVNYADYADFLTTLVSRYRGKVSSFQIWNEPNLAVEWAAPADARAYTELLKVGYTAVKAANPAAAVVMAGLAPTVDRVEQGGNQDELVYLQQMYDAGAGAYFDVGSVMIYGLGYAPDYRMTDQRLPGDNRRVNFSRVRLAREVMVRNGDSAKPLWPSEYGWVSIPDSWDGKPSSWGASVDEATQAQYLVEGYERAEAEWPWMGPMFVWHLRDPDPPAGEPQQFFSILNPDFSPRPAYNALAEWSRRYPVADTGAYLIAAGALRYDDTGATIRFSGTRLDLIYRSIGTLRGTLDGQVPNGWDSGYFSFPTVQSDPLPELAAWPVDMTDQLRRYTLFNHLSDEEHTLTFTYGVPVPQIVGFIVSREPGSPLLFPVVYALSGLIMVGSVVLFIRSRPASSAA